MLLKLEGIRTSWGLVNLLVTMETGSLTHVSGDAKEDNTTKRKAVKLRHHAFPLELAC